ncbi:MAG TPA: hypothetical protein VFO02_02460, partial [Burkholderiales bacterium]|nr:hypothetical protein [Burkholderiales bacterium]
PANGLAEQLAQLTQLVVAQTTASLAEKVNGPPGGGGPNPKYAEHSRMVTEDPFTWTRDEVARRQKTGTFLKDLETHFGVGASIFVRPRCTPS